MDTREYMKKYRAMQKELGICYNCGCVVEDGRTRCKECLEKNAKAQRERTRRMLEQYGDDYRRAKNEYMKKWQSENPDKVAVYKSKRTEYNRKYTYGE